jgi:hypothetical protein
MIGDGSHLTVNVDRIDSKYWMIVIKEINHCYQPNTTTHWYEHLNDATLADAILDRLLHNAIRLELKGESMRKNQKSLQKIVL